VVADCLGQIVGRIVAGRGDMGNLERAPCGQVLAHKVTALSAAAAYIVAGPHHDVAIEDGVVQMAL